MVVLVSLFAVSCATQSAGSRADPPARIQPRESIGGIALGMTAAQVRARLGPRDAQKPSELHQGWRQWVYRDSGVRVTFDESGTVWDVRTVSADFRTQRGAGVGSTEAQLREAFPGLRCRAAGPNGTGPARACVDVREYPGPFTQFWLSDGRTVSRVTVARGLAL